MSLFNQLVYYLLIGELILYVSTLVPLSFVPIPTRKRIMNSISKLTQSEPVVWTARIVFFVVAGVFLDTVSRLYRMENETGVLHKDVAGTHHHHLDNNPLSELQAKARLFYTQRNLYLSLFAIFMILVDYRRVRDVYLQLTYQEQIAEQTSKVRLLTRQVESMSGLAAATSKNALPKSGSTTTTTTTAVLPATETVIGSDVKAAEALRKRGTNVETSLD
ncbi:B-cell receptor-associated protein 31-like-domain-containing protein [Powellomyces hirtus]|nr:B-cell receptor-associated protein 31-like-domain-containing protein [Powellomyces hirtus]